MFEAQHKCKTLEIIYSNECFRFRFYNPQTDTDHPVQRQYISRLPANILNALLDRLWQNLISDYSYDELVNIGKLLFKQIIPHELAAQLEKESEGIMIVSEDQNIPWELLHDGKDFLGIKHVLGRCLVWSLNEKVLEDKKQINCLIISNPTGDLAEAENEAVSLMKFLRNHKLTCKYLARSEASLDQILLELNSYSYDFIHYSGHVVKDGNGEYSFALANEQYLTVNVINKLSFGRTLVFINGCSSGKIDISQHPDPIQTEISGVAVPFISAGAISVIGSLVRISDQGARQFAEIFYISILKGQSIGSAMVTARCIMKERYGDTDNIWASFVLYGNPALCYLDAENIGSKLKYSMDKTPTTSLGENKKIIEALTKKNKRMKTVNFILAFMLFLTLGAFIYKNVEVPSQQTIQIVNTPTLALEPTPTVIEFAFKNLSIEFVEARFDTNKKHFFIEIGFNRILSEEEKSKLKFNQDIWFYRKTDDLKFENFFPYWNAKPAWKEESGRTIRVIESDVLPPSANRQKLVYVAKLEGQKEIISKELFVSPG
jgi:CHAT domain-containing protein